MKVQLNTFSPKMCTKSPNFTGFRKKNFVADEYAVKIGNVLGIDAEKIKFKNNEELSFLSMLAEKYLSKYFYASEKENPDFVLNIFNAIKKPLDDHFAIIDYERESFEKIDKIFSLAKSKKELKFVRMIYEKIFSRNNSSNNMIVDMLKSPHKKDFVANLDDYLSYLKLNIKDEDAIKNLDRLISSGQYNRKIYDIRKSLGYLRNDLMLSKVINNQDMETFYSKSGRKFLDEFASCYYPRRNFDLSPQNKARFLEMYKTSNDKNIDLRVKIMRAFQ